ncbi:hypothetical protein MRX96_008385 [Rhipicephalus microplus]
MITQMESLADTLAERRFCLRNELRTLQDENVQLHGEPWCESDANCTAGTAGVPSSREVDADFRRRCCRGATAVSLTPCDRSCARRLLRGKRICQYQPFSDNDSCNKDLTFEGTGSSASTSRVIPSASSIPGPSGTSRRGRGMTRGGRSAIHVAGAKKSTNSKRGRGSALRSRPRPSLRTLTRNDSNASSSSPCTDLRPDSLCSVDHRCRRRPYHWQQIPGLRRARTTSTISR